jgi:hypothetical protein
MATIEPRSWVPNIQCWKRQRKERRGVTWFNVSGVGIRVERVLKEKADKVLDFMDTGLSVLCYYPYKHINCLDYTGRKSLLPGIDEHTLRCHIR